MKYEVAVAIPHAFQPKERERGTMNPDALTHLQNGLNIDPGLTPVEVSILSLLQTDALLTDPVIDIVLLQERIIRCDNFTLGEFCRGFMGLLARRLLEPHGEFRFVLSDYGRTYLSGGVVQNISRGLPEEVL